MILNLIIGSLMLGGIYGLVGLGYSTIYRASGMMNFAQGDLFMLGAFMGLTFYDFCGLPFILSLILAVLCMFIVGCFIQIGIIQTLQKKSAAPMYLVMATIAVSTLARNSAYVIWENKLFAFPKIFNTATLKIGNTTVMPESIMAVAVCLVCMVIIHLFMTKTKFGTAMRAAAQDPIAAKTCGINVSLTTAITWGIASAVAAVAGIMFGPTHYVIASMSLVVGQRGFSSAVIGGYGNMYGAIIGGMLIAFIETFTSAFISSNLKNFITFGVLMFFLFCKPTGIMNEKALKE